MKIQTLFIRVMPADKDRGYILLAGYDAQLVQTSCAYQSSLSDVSRKYLDESIARLQVKFDAVEVRDVTALQVQRKLQKMFDEALTPLPPKVKKVKDEDED